MALSQARESDRRIAQRFDLLAQVKFRSGPVVSLMELTNISMTGALLDLGSLRTPTWIKPDHVLEVGIIHPIDLDTIFVQGKVVRVIRDAGHTRFAVHFIELDDETLAGLGRLHNTALEASLAAHPSFPPELVHSSSATALADDVSQPDVSE